jgi:hypothetical protein
MRKLILFTIILISVPVWAKSHCDFECWRRADRIDNIINPKRVLPKLQNKWRQERVEKELQEQTRILRDIRQQQKETTR